MGKVNMQGKCSRCWWALDQSMGLGWCGETGGDPGDLQQPLGPVLAPEQAQSAWSTPALDLTHWAGSAQPVQFGECAAAEGCHSEGLQMFHG